MAERIPDPVCVAVRVLDVGGHLVVHDHQRLFRCRHRLSPVKPSPPSARLKSSAANGGVGVAVGVGVGVGVADGVAVGVGVGVADGHDSLPIVMNLPGEF